MGGGFQAIDIILFAVLALFLIFKLGSVLGRRGEDEGHKADTLSIPDRNQTTNDNVVELQGRHTPTAEEIASMTPLEAGIAQIKIADPSFREKEFIKGARMAFEMILDAFAKGDVKLLKTLLDTTVFENFSGAIQEREKAGHELETTIVGIDESEIIRASLDKNLASVTVKIVTEQVNALKDAAGEIIEGDPANVVKVTDVWTFCRNTKSNNPNWLLVATGSEG
ncbi:MAG: Tim44/TimA family putative adaptor protein [Alphaproteobacteria bacterium]|nr:Tim44/TimA family putative adaptor protein [Alphaproteobacteria bacterium]